MKKGCFTPEERDFIEIKMMIERKLTRGGYSSFCEMTTDITNGRPSKEIDFFFVAKNMDIFRKEVPMIMSVPFFFRNYAPFCSELS